MKLSEIKELKEYIDDWREAVTCIVDGEEDFCVQGYRFIKDTAIDRIMQDELSNEAYLLGCFNPNFLSEVIGIREEVFRSMQKSEAFEAIGMLILDGGYLEEFQQACVRWDGYGPHFAHYDGEENSFAAKGYPVYYVFRFD